jgi:hypothetical protein
MGFSILNTKFNKDFYNKEMRLKPQNEAPLAGFKCALQKWIESGTSKGNAVPLDSHYKFEKVDNMAGFLDVIDKE